VLETLPKFLACFSRVEGNGNNAFVNYDYR